MAVTKRMRYEILRRDNHACRYCGATAPEVKLTVDHVLPVALGGSDEPSNLVAACQPCNAGKSSSSPDAPIVDAVGDDALRWAQAMRTAAEILESERAPREEYVDAFHKAWCRWTWDGEPAPLPEDWKTSLRRFYSLNVFPNVIYDAIDSMAAAPNVYPWKRFNYFAGICWKHVKLLQDLTHDVLLIEGDDPQ